MKAILWTKYGPPEVLQLKEVEKPAPRDHEVLIRVYASTVTAGDCELRSLKGSLIFQLFLRFYLGLTRPTRINILGQELAGEIESVGKAVSRFKAGDQVFAWTGFHLGAYAEYICLHETNPEIKPGAMNYMEAAVLAVGGLEAAHFVRRGMLRSREKLLINGAGGSIGTFAVQLARNLGAEVTAVDSGGKLDMLHSIGANQVIDYTQEDFTTRGEKYDVIYDVIGKSSYVRSLACLSQNGRYLLGNPGLSQRMRRWFPGLGNGKQVLYWEGTRTPDDVDFLKQLVEAGKIRSVIDRSYPMEQIADAHRYVETGQKKGNVVITIE